MSDGYENLRKDMEWIVLNTLQWVTEPKVYGQSKQFKYSYIFLLDTLQRLI